MRHHETPPVLVTVRAGDGDDDGGGRAPMIAALLGLDPDAVLAVAHCSAAGTPTRVWDVLAWVPVPADDVAELLTRAADGGRLAAWSVLVPGTQRSFVRVVDAARPRLDRPPTRVSLHGPLDGMAIATYRELFLEHCGVTEQHMRRALAYRQTEVARVLGDAERPVHGVSEFWFRTAEQAAHMYDDEVEAAAVGEHARRFVAAARSVTVRGTAADGSA